MTIYLIRRLLLMIPILLLVTVMVFGLIHVVPGDPARMILGEESTPQALAALRHQLGLDRPLAVQYATWIWGVLRGDLGRSLIDQTPVSTLILQRLPVTLELAALTFLVSLVIAVPAGIISAAYRGRAPDVAANVVALSGLSIPPFWLGILFILYFAVKLHWLPASGYVSPSVSLMGNLKAMLMPAVATGFREAAVVTRFLRSSLLETLGSDFVRTARAKGLGERAVLLGHALRNALIPVITVSGLQVAGLLGGLVITETIFGLPGFGSLIVDSIFNRDFITVQGAVLVSGVLVVAVNLVVDILYSLVDPRIRLGGGETK